MRVVCISDTHEHHREIDVPEGDMVVCSGDISMMGDVPEVVDFLRWLRGLPHAHKVLIAGNHDFCFEQRPEVSAAMLQAEGEGITYLQDSGAELGGLKVWGSPWQPWFYDWAFNLARGEAIAAKWALIPEGTDLLVTHGPPWGILDETPRGQKVGCEELLNVVARVRPRLHVFGHIHHGYGKVVQDGTTFVNACSCDEGYRAVNPPIVVEM